MSITKGKHIVKELEEVRCTIVESNVNRDRLEFLTALLELNGYEVKFVENPPVEEGDEISYTLGVTSMIFNPVIAVYQRLLRTKEGRRVTPDYWNQKTTEIEPNYWDKKKK